MFLLVGNQSRIDNPTPGQIGHALRNLPAEAPFVVLDADCDQFVQATPAQTGWRVEWRQEGRQWVLVTELEQAEAVFAAFGRWDEPALLAMPWKRLRVWNDSYRRLVFVAATVAMLSAVGFWSAWQ